MLIFIRRKNRKKNSYTARLRLKVKRPYANKVQFPLETDQVYNPPFMDNTAPVM